MQKKKFDYKWVVIASCFVMVFISLGFCSSTRSLYMSAICDALGFSRSAYSIADTCRYVSTCIVNFFFGALVAKLGMRKLICAGFISLILSCVINSFAENIFLFYVSGTLLGIGLSWTTTTMVGAVVTKWCKKSKGTIMGFILAANGVGGAFATQIVSPIIYNESISFGYRNAYRLVAVILLAVGALVVAFFRDNPKNPEADDGADAGKNKRAKKTGGMEYKALVRHPFYYSVLLCVFITGMVLTGINGIAVVHMKDVGLDPDYIAMTLSFHSLMLAAAKFLTGYIYDKKGLRVAATTCCVFAVVSMVMLASVTPTTTGKVLAMIYGLISSFALPLETVMLPIYAGDLFGENSFYKVLGVMSSVNSAGYALGSPAVNLCYDNVGSYTPALLAGAFLMVIVAVSLQFIISYAKKDGKENN